MHSIHKISNKVVDIDPLILFPQLILLAKREEDGTSCKFTQCKFTYRYSTSNLTDGGALLYRVKWKLYTKFSDIYMLYKIHLYNKFGYCYVVLDGYGNGPSTKDKQHIKRNGKVLPNITFTSDTKCIKF